MSLYLKNFFEMLEVFNKSIKLSLTELFYARFKSHKSILPLYYFCIFLISNTSIVYANQLSLLEDKNIDLITSSLEFNQYNQGVYRSDDRHQYTPILTQFLAQENLDLDDYSKFSSYSTVLPGGILLSSLIFTTTTRPSFFNTSLFFAILAAAGVSFWMWNRNNQVSTEVLTLNQDQTFISNLQSSKNDHLRSDSQHNAHFKSAKIDPFSSSSDQKPPQKPTMVPEVQSLKTQENDQVSIKDIDKISPHLISANLGSYQISPFHTLANAPYFNEYNLRKFWSLMVKEKPVNKEIWESFFVKTKSLTYQDIATKHSSTAAQVETIHVEMKMHFAALMLENIEPSQSLKLFRYFPGSASVEDLEKLYLSLDYDEIIFRYLEYSKYNQRDGDFHFANLLKSSPEYLTKHHIDIFNQEILFNNKYHSEKTIKKIKKIYFSLMLGLNEPNKNDVILFFNDLKYESSKNKNLSTSIQRDKILDQISTYAGNISIYFKEIVLFGKIISVTRNKLVGFRQTDKPFPLEQQRLIYQSIDKEMLLFGFEMGFLQKKYMKKHNISKANAIDSIMDFERWIKGFFLLEQVYYGLVANIDGTDFTYLINRYKKSKIHISAVKNQIKSLIIDAVRYGHKNYIINPSLRFSTNKPLSFEALEKQYYQMIMIPYLVGYRLLTYHPFSFDQKQLLLQFTTAEYSFLLRKITKDKLDYMIARKFVNNDIIDKISSELCRHIFFTKFLNIGSYDPQEISNHYSIPLVYVHNIADSIYVEIFQFLLRYKLMHDKPVRRPNDQKILITNAQSMLEFLNLSMEEIVNLHKKAFSININDSQDIRLSLMARDNFFNFLFKDVINDYAYWIVYKYLIEIEEISDYDREYLEDYDYAQLDRISTYVQNKLENYFVTYFFSR